MKRKVHDLRLSQRVMQAALMDRVVLNLYFKTMRLVEQRSADVGVVNKVDASMVIRSHSNRCGLRSWLLYIVAIVELRVGVEWYAWCRLTLTLLKKMLEYIVLYPLL